LLLKRSLNLSRLVAGYALSRVTRKAVQPGLPFSISIEPTNLCNLRCPECPSGAKTLTRDRGMMDMGLFRTIIDQLSGELAYVTLYFQGEPYLHKDFHEIVRYAKSKNIYVATSTNGHFLTPENCAETIRSGLDKLIVSLDGLDQGAYSSYRAGGSYEQVVAGIREMSARKAELSSRKPFTEIQFLVFKTNQHQLGGIGKLKILTGADSVKLKTAQHYDFADGNPLMTDIARYSRYKMTGTPENPSWEIRNRMPHHCWRMWSSCVITWDGTVVPCCFDKDALFPMGNIAGTPFREIWTGSEYNAFRQRVLDSRGTIGICRNCTEGTGLSYFL
jgi:radical SAM protein with 4Fe4S-binding SPASM domain